MFKFLHQNKSYGKKSFKQKRAFTLVELVVVVVIIGILASLGVLNYSWVRKDARDTARIGDLKVISNALENELSLGNFLPNPSDIQSEKKIIDGKEFTVGVFSGDEIKERFKDYLSNIPVDPSNGTEYVYALRNDGKKYILKAVLENGEDYYITNFMDSSGLLALNKTKSDNKQNITIPGTSVPNTGDVSPTTPVSPANPGNSTPTPPSKPEVTPLSNTKPNTVESEYIDRCFNYRLVGDEVTISRFLGSCRERDIVIPQNINGKKVTAIADRSFLDADIDSIVLPEAINYIGSNAFSGVPLTGDLNLPNLTSLGTNAFKGGQFTSINFPKLNRIGKNA